MCLKFSVTFVDIDKGGRSKEKLQCGNIFYEVDSNGTFGGFVTCVRSVDVRSLSKQNEKKNISKPVQSANSSNTCTSKNAYDDQ